VLRKFGASYGTTITVVLGVTVLARKARELVITARSVLSKHSERREGQEEEREGRERERRRVRTRYC
jgi:hypothetical protein